jgi:hypothetical protein
VYGWMGGCEDDAEGDGISVIDAKDEGGVDVEVVWLVTVDEADGIFVGRCMTGSDGALDDDGRLSEVVAGWLAVGRENGFPLRSANISRSRAAIRSSALLANDATW